MESAQPYSSMTYGSKNALFRFTHTKRLSLATGIVDPQPGERILDFGAGDGHVIGELAKACPGAYYTMLEPYLTPVTPVTDHIAWIRDIAERKAEQFDKVVTFETLEHVTPKGMDDFIAILKNNLRPGGTCIISMPVEVGPPAILKYAARRIFRRTHEGNSFGNAVKSLFFRTETIPRPVGEEGFIYTHIGFDAFKAARRIMKEVDLQLVRRVTSPFTALPWFVNSQIYFVLRKRG